VGRILLGSTAERVLQMGTGDVVLVGPHVEGWLPTGRVVACLDRARDAATTAATAAVWSRRLRMPLTLLHVVETDGLLPLERDDDRAALARLADEVAGSHEVEVLVERGDAAGRVVRAARAGDLLVMAAHVRTGVARLLLGSTTLRVAVRVPCPVVVTSCGRAG
jgi:nucleotide-binding universal stress UspA family protein